MNACVFTRVYARLRMCLRVSTHAQMRILEHACTRVFMHSILIYRWKSYITCTHTCISDPACARVYALYLTCTSKWSIINYTRTHAQLNVIILSWKVYETLIIYALTHVIICTRECTILGASKRASTCIRGHARGRVCAQFIYMSPT